MCVASRLPCWEDGSPGLCFCHHGSVVSRPAMHVHLSIFLAGAQNLNPLVIVRLSLRRRANERGCVGREGQQGAGGRTRVEACTNAIVRPVKLLQKLPFSLSLSTPVPQTWIGQRPVPIELYLRIHHVSPIQFPIGPSLRVRKKGEEQGRRSPGEHRCGTPSRPCECASTYHYVADGCYVAWPAADPTPRGAHRN